MGISRFVKFKHIYENILKMPYSSGVEEALGRKFSDIVFKEALNAPFVPGALEFLDQNVGRYVFFIASGTPEGELLEILKKRRINRYFKKISGSPKTKPDIITSILKGNALNPREAVFVGDATSDMSASAQTGVNFIARLNSENSDLFKDQRWKIDDLTFLSSILRDIEQCR